MRLSLEDSLRADAWAMSRLRQYEHGKLIMHAWMSRGLITAQQLADWHFAGNMDQLKDSMKRTLGGMKTILRLEDLCDKALDGVDPERKALAQASESTILPGEKKIVWAIRKPDDPPDGPHTPLPDWFKNPITRAIVNWQKEAAKWQTRINNRRDRNLKGLTPKQQSDFEKWQESTCRRIVLNKQRKAQVMNVRSDNLKQIKSNCILLEVQMSDCAENLRIRSGDGSWFRLVMLEGIVPASDVPAALDVAPGVELKIWTIYTDIRYLSR